MSTPRSTCGRWRGPPRIGDKVRLIPPHCDPTVNLHDWLVCIRGERVVDLWPVSARGPGSEPRRGRLLRRAIAQRYCAV